MSNDRELKSAVNENLYFGLELIIKPASSLVKIFTPLSSSEVSILLIFVSLMFPAKPKFKLFVF